MRHLTSILILVVIASLGLVGLSSYINTAHGQSGGLITTTSAPGASTQTGAQVLSLLTRLNGLDLNGQVFTNPAFQSLQDWSVSIAPQPAGRPNPYLPTGSTPVAPSKATVTKPSTPQFLKR